MFYRVLTSVAICSLPSPDRGDSGAPGCRPTDDGSETRRDLPDASTRGGTMLESALSAIIDPGAAVTRGVINLTESEPCAERREQGMSHGIQATWAASY